jgi:hypothetical protein
MNESDLKKKIHLIFMVTTKPHQKYYDYSENDKILRREYTFCDVSPE